MVVRLFGLLDGRRVEKRWTLVASDGHGPEIQTLAAALRAGRILAGGVAPGARDAGGELDAADFDESFAKLSIRHDTVEIPQPDALHARVMGERFALLAPSVAAIHGVLRDGGAAGRAVVTRGGHPLARLVAALLQFPTAGDHPLHVAFGEREGVERWTRAFSGRRFASELSERRSETASIGSRRCWRRQRCCTRSEWPHRSVRVDAQRRTLRPRFNHQEPT